MFLDSSVTCSGLPPAPGVCNRPSYENRTVPHIVIPMKQPFILASGSSVRAELLKQINLPFEVIIPRIDEEMVRSALLAEEAKPRDIADTLAELKARKVSEKHSEALVLGCDQVLDHEGNMLSKPTDKAEAIEHLSQLQGSRHSLLSAAVLYEGGQPVWRHVGQVRLRMRPLSPTFVSAYVDRNWDSIRHAVGCYKLEEEGARLFSTIEGDYFHVLGMPFLELINYLTLRGDLET